MMWSSRALLPLALLLPGCGATTARIELTPTMDTDGGSGFESMFSLGVGMPLDYAGRSHHYVQALGGLGGGAGGAIGSGYFGAATAFDYIYWAEPSMDLRAGLRLTYRGVPTDHEALDLYGLGGHFALLPMVLGDAGSWIPIHLGVGPEFRLEHVWLSPKGAGRNVFSLPLVIEVSALAAGD